MNLVASSAFSLLSSGGSAAQSAANQVYELLCRQSSSSCHCTSFQHGRGAGCDVGVTS